MAQPNTMTPQAAQAPAQATDAVCTLAAPSTGSGARWIIDSIAWSYSAAPTGGQLIIAWGSVQMLFYVPASGPGILSFSEPLRLPIETAGTITLKSGAGTVIGTVYPQAHTG